MTATEVVTIGHPITGKCYQIKKFINHKNNLITPLAKFQSLQKILIWFLLLFKAAELFTTKMTLHWKCHSLISLTTL